MKNTLSDCILGSIMNPSTIQVLGESTEVIIDSTLDYSILKDIPFASWIISAKNIYTTISDEIFFAKVYRFLNCLSNVPENEKEEFNKKLNKDRAYKKKVGESLLLIINKLDDLDKSSLIATVFKSFLRGHISYEKFMRLSDSISIAYIEDLQMLQQDNIDDMERLYKSGLSQIVRHNTFPLKLAGQAELLLSFEVSELGQLLKEILKR